MTGLDLRIRPPRAPRERLDGLMFMPRTIDKIRATLPGGHSGAYHVTPGMSAMLLSIIDVDLAALREAVVMAGSDDEVAAWLRTHADTSRYQHANTVLSEWRHENVPDEHRAHFESLYPEYLRSHYPIGFDLIEADERDLYPSLRKSEAHNV